MIQDNLDYKAIGRRVRAARKNAKMTQEQLVEKAGVSASHISNIETGSTKVSLPTLVKIVNALGVSLDYICCDSLFYVRMELCGQFADILDQLDDDKLRILLDVTETLKESIQVRLRLEDKTREK